MKSKNRTCCIFQNQALMGVIVGGIITFIIQWYTINEQHIYDNKVNIIRTYPTLKSHLDGLFLKFYDVSFDLYQAIDKNDDHSNLSNNFIKIHLDLTSAVDEINWFVIGYSGRDISAQNEFQKNINNIKEFLLNNDNHKSPRPMLSAFSKASSSKKDFFDKTDEIIKSYIGNY